MRIALISHSYHQHTRSHEFFLPCLLALGTVEVFFDESWRNARAAWIDGFDCSRFDIIVVWQVGEAIDYIRWPHGNVVFVPMYDAQGGTRFWWKEEFNQAKVLCFSEALRREVAQRTDRLRGVKYYPDPGEYPEARRDGLLRGLFWNRVPAIDLTAVAKLCGEIVFDSFTVHDAPDPLSGAVLPERDWPVQARQHRRSTWKERGDEYRRLLAEHSVFFAPRPYEGIGLSLLEAMAAGLCPVAPDTSTHNEYIADGVTGLLYNLDKPAAVDLRRACEMGARARESVARGHAEWLRARPELLDFLAAPTASTGGRAGA
jgi:glycosyltransferase involved in cell wall biosynthesis